MLQETVSDQRLLEAQGNEISENYNLGGADVFISTIKVSCHLVDRFWLTL